MKYLKVFTDLASSLTALNDAECGRLFRAMLEYAASGREPDLRGNERYVWPSVKAGIDRGAETYRRKADIAQENAKKRKAERQKNAERNHTISYDIDTISCDIVQEEEEDNEKEIVPPSIPPAGEDAAAARYVDENLRSMTSGNWEELRSYLDDGLTPELIHHAVDEAAAHGSRNWAYVRRILNRYLTEGVTSVEQAKATVKTPDPPKKTKKVREWICVNGERQLWEHEVTV